MENIYKGITFFRYEKDKNLKEYDKSLVERDLLNHIFTRKGERIKMPDFGTTIPDLVFEQLTQELVVDIEFQLRTVFNYDPRVELISIDVIPNYDKNTLYVYADLYYIELDMTSRFELNLDFKG